MTEMQGGEAAAVDTTAQAAVEAAVSSQDQGSGRDYEAEARESGWRPKEEWQGKPENWKDAKTWIDHGDTSKRIATIEKRLQEEYAARFEKLEKATDRTIKELQERHAADIESLKAQKREAVKAGDADAVDAIDAKLEKLRSEKPEKQAEKTNEEVQLAWQAKNPWYDADEDMRAYAYGYSNDLAARNPNMSLEENLRRTEERVKAKYPDKFGEKTKEKPAANGHAAVDGGGSLAGVLPAKSTAFSKLTDEARRQFEREVSLGRFKDTAADREEFANLYNS